MRCITAICPAGPPKLSAATRAQALAAWPSETPGAALAAAQRLAQAGELRPPARVAAEVALDGGGSGWALLTWSHRDRRLMNQWAADHTMTLAGATPILALDMYEHAYAMDYGARAAGYVDAFMAAVNWKNADALYARASASA